MKPRLVAGEMFVSSGRHMNILTAEETEPVGVLSSTAEVLSKCCKLLLKNDASLDLVKRKKLF